MKRKLVCNYLYTDGTLVQVYDETRKGINVGQTVDLTLGYCEFRLTVKNDTPYGKDATTGRMVIDRYDESQGFLTLAKGGSINASMPSVGNGSPKSQALNIAVQHVVLRTAKGLKLEWTDATGIMSSQFHLQNDSWVNATHHETLTPGSHWGSATVWAVKDMRVNKAVAA